MSRWFLKCAILIFFPICLITGGCGATVYSPVLPIDPTKIYVADYGRHSSIFLPIDNGAFVEYSFGDWNYYAQGKTSNSDGIVALFWSGSATLGRRYAHSVDAAADPPHLFEPRIFHLSVARSDMERVRDELETHWHSLVKTKVYNPIADTEFVRDTTHYSWLYNCNNWTAEILRNMGCKVVGITSFSAFRSGDKTETAATTK